MTLKLPTDLRNNMLDEITAKAGSGAISRIYAGTQPATGGGALSGNTLLGSLVAGSPFAPAAANGVLDLNAIADDVSADDDGIAVWFRVVKSDGSTWVMDGTCGTSGADMNLNTVTFTAGARVSIADWKITAPNPA